MPTINKLQKKKRDTNYIHPNTIITHEEVYNTPKWKALRKLKITNEPLCYRCYEHNRITLAVEVHHIIPILTDISKAFEYENLMSLCSPCHDKEHNK